MIERAYLVPFNLAHGVQIAEFRELGPSGIRHDDVQSSQCLGGLLDDSDAILLDTCILD